MEVGAAQAPAGLQPYRLLAGLATRQPDTARNSSLFAPLGMQDEIFLTTKRLTALYRDEGIVPSLPGFQYNAQNSPWSHMRPDWDSYFMKIACCVRTLHLRPGLVGCVLVLDKRILTTVQWLAFRPAAL